MTDRAFRLASAAILLAAFPSLAQDSPAGKNQSANAAWVARSAEGQPWQVVGADDAIRTGATYFGLPGASFVSANGAVKLTASSDFGGKSPLPVLEAAVIPKPADGADLNLTLDRGRIDLENVKDSGAATVKIGFLDQSWELTLQEPGTVVAVKTFGRWPAGVVFKDEKDRPVEPIVYTLALVVKGKATLKTSDAEVKMTEPPGTAVAFWESSTGKLAPPLHLNEAPEWAVQSASDDRAKQVVELLNAFRAAREKSGPDGAIEAFVASDDELKQRVALVAMGAQDDMVGLSKVLASAKNPHVWDTGVVVARHWLGRNAGQRDKILQFLTEERGFSKSQARSAVDLLNGFTEEELSSPLLYQLLIRTLGAAENPVLRNLAAWHLYRLVPGAREKIPFKPNATDEEFAQLAKAWGEYLPPGKVPGDIGTEDGPVRKDEQ